MVNRLFKKYLINMGNLNINKKRLKNTPYKQLKRENNIYKTFLKDII